MMWLPAPIDLPARPPANPRRAQIHKRPRAAPPQRMSMEISFEALWGILRGQLVAPGAGGGS